MRISLTSPTMLSSYLPVTLINQNKLLYKIQRLTNNMRFRERSEIQVLCSMKERKSSKKFPFFVGQRKKQIQPPERRRRDQYWGRNLTRVSNDQRLRFDHLHVAESQLILKVKRSKVLWHVIILDLTGRWSNISACCFRQGV